MNTQYNGTNPPNFINSAIIAVALIVVAFLLSMKLDQYLKNQAVDQCEKISKYEVTIPADNAKSSYPLVDVYKNCLKDKGYTQ